MKTHKQLSNNTSAVSPIIAEILMVAIVVILGAIIASYAFGSTDKIQDKNYLVGMSADKINEDNIVVTFSGGGDADKVLHLYVTVNGSYYDGTSNTWSAAQVDTFGGDGTNPIQVGKTILIIDDPANHISAGRDKVIITAGFMDGVQQVVLNTMV